MATFSECFNIIITGDKEASRKAVRQVRKLIYSFAADGRDVVVGKFYLTRFLGYAIIKLLKPPALLSQESPAGF